jgi:hypothetical protein
MMGLVTFGDAEAPSATLLESPVVTDATTETIAEVAAPTGVGAAKDEEAPESEGAGAVVA